jgi:hypothetical protein
VVRRPLVVPNCTDVFTGGRRVLAIAGCIVLQAIASSCADDAAAGRSRRAKHGASDVDADAASDANGEIRDAALADAAASDAETDASVQTELRARLIELLRQVEREASMRCPCLVETGAYPSEETCLETVAFKPGWEACVEYVPVPAESDEALSCALEELNRRNDCLQPAACDRSLLGMCRAATIECPKLDPEVLVRVLQRCPRYVMLFH